MVNQQLLDYIKQQLQLGVNKEQITNTLLGTGWQKQTVEEAFSSLSNQNNQSPTLSLSTPTAFSLPGAIEILQQAWNIYKQRLGTFLGITIAPTLLTVATILAMIPLFAGGSFLIGLNNASLENTIGGKTALLIFSIILLIIIFIAIVTIQIWGQTALLYAIKDSEEKIGVIEAYRRGWRKIIPYWWTSLLMGIIIAGGFGLLFIPGGLFALWFGLAPFISVAEDLKGMDALLKSKEYGRGKWGSIIWRFLVIAIISLIIILVISFIFNLLKIQYGEEIINLITALFVPPFTTTYSFLIYSHLKKLKGEFSFSPAKGKKAVYILIGIFGILIIPAIIFLTIFSKYRSIREKPLYQQNELFFAPNESSFQLPEESSYY